MCGCLRVSRYACVRLVARHECGATFMGRIPRLYPVPCHLADHVARMARFCLPVVCLDPRSVGPGPEKRLSVSNVRIRLKRASLMPCPHPPRDSDSLLPRCSFVVYFNEWRMSPAPGQVSAAELRGSVLTNPASQPAA